jgi:hypothetical protein
MLLSCPVCSDKGRFYEGWEGIVWGLAFDFREIGPAERAVRRARTAVLALRTKPVPNNQLQRRRDQRELELKRRGFKLEEREF